MKNFSITASLTGDDATRHLRGLRTRKDAARQRIRARRDAPVEVDLAVAGFVRMPVGILGSTVAAWAILRRRRPRAPITSW
jgi:hypothetical protein